MCKNSKFYFVSRVDIDRNLVSARPKMILRVIFILLYVLVIQEVHSEVQKPHFIS